MILHQSMSQDPLSEGEREELVLKPLADTPVRHWCLLCRRWANFTPEDQSYWHDVIVLDRTVQFKGSVLSRSRRQIELTLIFNPPRPCGSATIRFCITLEDFDQVLWEDEDEIGT